MRLKHGNSAPPVSVEADASLPFSCREIANVNVRILGPERMWGGEIAGIPMQTAAFQELLNATAKGTKICLAGYIVENGNGTLRYHMSRLPRRINLSVPDVDVFKQAFQNLQDTLIQRGLSFCAKEEQAIEKPELRVVMGLEEGYFESRRKDLLRQIDQGRFSSLAQLQEAFLQRIGEASKWGLNLDTVDTLAAAQAAIASASMSRLHAAGQVRDILSSDFKVTPALIHSVSPDYIYTEPAVEISASQTLSHFEAITLLAAEFNQARFSLEHLDTLEAFNVEILQDSGNSAASFA